MERKSVNGGFVTAEVGLPGLCYVLTEPWRPELAEVMAAEGAQFLRLSRAMGWKCEPLEFLPQLKDLRGVEIYHWDVSDLRPLLGLPSLELLGLECRFRRIDFAAGLPRLRWASVTWRPGAESLFGCARLEYFSASNYPYEDLSPLRETPLLRELFVASRKLSSAGGLGRQTSLRKLTFSFCTSLQDIGPVSELTGLESLQLATCKRIGDLEALRSLHNLRRAIVENCGEIASVEPLRGLDNLEELYLPGTTVADGALQPLLELKSLRRVALPKSARHSHTSDQINAALAARA